MMSTRVWWKWMQRGIGLVASLLVACAAEVPDEDGFLDEDYIGQATFEILQVPSGVGCIRIEVTGPGTVTKDFALAVGTSTASLAMDRLPSGTLTVNGKAYATTCGTNTPTWIADPASVLIDPGIVSTISLTFRKNNPVTASANFVGNIQGIAAGQGSTYLLVDGNVYQWGSSTGSMAPAVVPGLSGGIQLSANGTAACVLKDDGTIWCWGSNAYGLLGPGVTSTTVPVQVATGRSYRSISVGSDHACAVASTSNADGIYCWGSNASGQLAAPLSTTSSSTALQSRGPVNAMVAAGGQFTCSIGQETMASCVGAGGYGQLGNGGTASSTSWITVSGGSPVVGLAVGGTFSLFIMADGSLKATGYNGTGALGLGNTTSVSTPTVVPGLSVKTIVAGGGHTVALLTNGSVRTWGSNSHGQLGDNSLTNRTSPIAIGVPASKYAAAGSYHTCVVTTGDDIYCFGRNEYGQLGDGTRINSATPLLIRLP